MARSFKDDSAFNNWERDIKKISKKQAPEKISLAQFKKEVQDILCDRLKSVPSSRKIQGYMTRGASKIKTSWEELGVNDSAIKQASQTARDIERDCPEEDYGFSHHRAAEWGDQSGAIKFEEPKKRRTKKIQPTNEGTEDQQGDQAA